MHKMLQSEDETSSPPNWNLPEVPAGLREKTERMLRQIRECERVIVAFSGGVDSTLVAYLSKLALDDGVIAATANSPSLSSSELDEAKGIAKQIGMKHIIVQTEELNDPNYVSNSPNRCYFCKKELARKLKELAVELKVPVLMDGTNADDLTGHRPGAAAFFEEGVKRPVAEVGMSKAEVRELSRLFGLSTFDKPSNPCLSSRVQYGQLITPERLSRIERAEASYAL